MTVVKADAYGHGLKQIAALLMQSGADIFGVANLTEARAIRSVGKGWPILMLGACLPDEIDLAIRENVTATLSSLDEARAFSRAAVSIKRIATAHLKVDTGMGRLGAPPEDIPNLVDQIQRLPNLKLSGLYTHYSSVESDPTKTRRQRRLFDKLTCTLTRSGTEFDHIHCANSSGLLWETGGTGNTVRPGLLVYGVAPPGARRGVSMIKAHLLPAMSLKCRVSFLKSVPRGTSLSYGGSFVAPRQMKIATLSAGYGDGYPRAAGNRARVLVGGRLCPVVGWVTMDQTLVDVSRVAPVNVGDEAVLFGDQGKKRITATELADWCDTVPWEILTRISGRVPRIYLGGHAA